MASQKTVESENTEKDIQKVFSIGTAFAAIAVGLLVNDPIVSDRIANHDFEKR